MIKQERQNKNAHKIALESGKLYDKFVGFMEDLEKIGKSIEKSSKHYDDALKKMSFGSGNILGKVEKIRELGAKTGKKLPDSFNELVDKN